MGWILGAAAALWWVPSAHADDALAPPAGEPSFLTILTVAMLVVAPILLVLLWISDVIRPGSMRRGAALRRTDGVRGGAWLLAWLAVMIGTALSSLLAIPLVRVLGEQTLAAQAAASLAGYGGGFAVALAIIASFARLEPRAGLRVMPGDAPTGIVVLAIAFPIVTAAGVLATFVARALGATPEAIGHETLREMVDARGSSASLIMAAVAVVGAPVLEEIAYRGFLQSGVRRITGMPWLSVLLTSAVFAGSHAGAVEPSGLVGLFVLGIALGVAFERRASLGVPIVIHMGFNALNIALAFSIGIEGGDGTMPP